MVEEDYSKRELIGIIENEFGRFKVYRPLMRDMWELDVNDPRAAYKMAANCTEGLTVEELGEWYIDDALKLSDLLSGAIDILGKFK